MPTPHQFSASQPSAAVLKELEVQIAASKKQTNLKKWADTRSSPLWGQITDENSVPDMNSDKWYDV